VKHNIFVQFTSFYFSQISLLWETFGV